MFTLRIFGIGESSDHLRASGDVARDQRNWGAAADYYVRYLKRQPEDAAIWVQLGHCRKELGDREAAERAYLRAHSIEPSNPDTQVQIGRIEKLNGRLEQALAWFRKALLADPALDSARQEVEQVERLLPVNILGTEQSDLEARLTATFEQRIAALADQFGAIKAVAEELQRVRQCAEAVEGRLAELTTTVKEFDRTQTTITDEHAERLATLEATAPVAQHSFPALLSRLSELNAHRAELERCCAKVDRVERQLNGLGLQHD